MYLLSTLLILLYLTYLKYRLNRYLKYLEAAINTNYLHTYIIIISKISWNSLFSDAELEIGWKFV